MCRVPKSKRPLYGRSCHLCSRLRRKCQITRVTPKRRANTRRKGGKDKEAECQSEEKPASKPAAKRKRVETESEDSDEDPDEDELVSAVRAIGKAFIRAAAALEKHDL